MEKRKGIVTMKGNPVTLVGNPIKEGQAAPDFSALNLDMSPFTLSENFGKKNYHQHCSVFGYECM